MENNKIMPFPGSKSKTKKKPTLTYKDMPGYYTQQDDLKNNSKTTLFDSIERTVDSATGEVISDKKTTLSKRQQEPDYVKIYLADIGKLKDLQPNQNELLYHFLQYLDYDNEITLVKNKKLLISEKTGISLSTIDNAITAFLNKGILLRKARSVYRANPYLFGRGKWEDISKIRMEVIYSENGIELSSEMEYKNNDK
jgi:hypothetical protein